MSTALCWPWMAGGWRDNVLNLHRRHTEPAATEPGCSIDMSRSQLMTSLHSAEQCRQKISDLIAEAVREPDLDRREGLLELADQWSEVARRRGPGETLN